LLYAYTEATVPKITVVLRKAYGGAYDVMASKHVRADVNLAFPMAEFAVVGAEAAVNILHRKELQAALDPDMVRALLVERYRDEFANPYQAAERGYVDEVIQPRLLRQRLAQHLDMLETKCDDIPAKKHGNIPL
jgi:propionyl-CoA carboxylase beta chain